MISSFKYRWPPWDKYIELVKAESMWAIDSIQASAILELKRALDGEELWNCVQQRPHGKFYANVLREHLLHPTTQALL